MTKISNRLNKKQALAQLTTALAGPVIGLTGHGAQPVTWTYRLTPDGILKSSMDDGVTRLEISFALSKLKKVTITRQGLMLQLADKTIVSGPDAQQSYDHEWPLILDWAQKPGLKEQLQQWFTALIT